MCLLVNTGLSQALASQRWFALTSACMKGKSTGEVLQLLDRLLSRIYVGAIDEQEKHPRVMLAFIRTMFD